MKVWHLCLHSVSVSFTLSENVAWGQLSCKECQSTWHIPRWGWRHLIDSLLQCSVLDITTIGPLRYSVIVLKPQNPRFVNIAGEITSQVRVLSMTSRQHGRSEVTISWDPVHLTSRKDVWPPYTTNTDQDCLRCIPLPLMSLLFLYLNPKLMSVAWWQTRSQWTFPVFLFNWSTDYISPLLFICTQFF